MYGDHGFGQADLLAGRLIHVPARLQVVGLEALHLADVLVLVHATALDTLLRGLYEDVLVLGEHD